MHKPEIQTMKVAISPAGQLTSQDLNSALKTMALSMVAVGLSAMLNHLIVVVIPSIPADNPYWMILSPAILAGLKMMQKYVEQRIYPVETVK